jgi:hypothetical protein
VRGGRLRLAGTFEFKPASRVQTSAHSGALSTRPRLHAGGPGTAGSSSPSVHG